MSLSSSHIYSLIMTLALHGLVVLVLLVHWQFEFPDATPELSLPDYVNVSLTSSNPYTEQMTRSASKKPPSQTKRATPPSNVEPVAKKVKEVSKEEPVGEIPKKEQLAEFRAKERLEMEDMLADLVAEEQEVRQAITDDEKAMAYVQQIQADIIRNWSRPPSARNGMEVLLRVFLVPTGELVEVVIEDSSGNDVFDRSALLAVERAEPFDVPGDPTQFERYFRQFTVLFRPEDLRL